MVVTERSRHQLFKRLEEVLGMEEAGTLMNLVPPMGWGDLATKRDLDLLKSDLKGELASKLRGLFFAIAALFLAVVSLLLAAPHWI